MQRRHRIIRIQDLCCLGASGCGGLHREARPQRLVGAANPKKQAITEDAVKGGLETISLVKVESRRMGEKNSIHRREWFR